MGTVIETGMYTECRGFLKLDYIDYKDREKTINKIKQILKNFENKTPRANQCINSSIFHSGFNGVHYIFIGGEIKNYDNDWEEYIEYLKNNLDIEEAFIETKYEENDNFSTLYKK